MLPAAERSTSCSHDGILARTLHTISYSCSATQVVICRISLLSRLSSFDYFWSNLSHGVICSLLRVPQPSAVAVLAQIHTCSGQDLRRLGYPHPMRSESDWSMSRGAVAESWVGVLALSQCQFLCIGCSASPCVAASRTRSTDILTFGLSHGWRLVSTPVLPSAWLCFWGHSSSQYAELHILTPVLLRSSSSMHRLQGSLLASQDVKVRA